VNKFTFWAGVECWPGYLLGAWLLGIMLWGRVAILLENDGRPMLRDPPGSSERCGMANPHRR
jgi:hypothetical protein